MLISLALPPGRISRAPLLHLRRATTGGLFDRYAAHYDAIPTAGSKHGRISSMKLSVSLPDEDVKFLDEYAKAHARSRSGAVHEAIATLRRDGLGDAYERAWDEWADGEDAELWEQPAGDGL
jgi:predicted transcriptional regulator